MGKKLTWGCGGFAAGGTGRVTSPSWGLWWRRFGRDAATSVQSVGPSGELGWWHDDWAGGTTLVVRTGGGQAPQLSALALNVSLSTAHYYSDFESITPIVHRWDQ